MQRRSSTKRISLSSRIPEEITNLKLSHRALPSLNSPRADPFLNMKISDKKTLVLKPICLAKHKPLNSSLSASKLTLPSKFRRIVLEPVSLEVVSEATPKLSAQSTSQAYLPFSSHFSQRRQSEIMRETGFSKDALEVNQLACKVPVKIHSRTPREPLPRIYNFLQTPKSKIADFDVVLKFPRSLATSQSHKKMTLHSKPFQSVNRKSVLNEKPIDMSFGDIDQHSAALF